MSDGCECLPCLSTLVLMSSRAREKFGRAWEGTLSLDTQGFPSLSHPEPRHSEIPSPVPPLGKDMPKWSFLEKNLLCSLERRRETSESLWED